MSIVILELGWNDDVFIIHFGMLSWDDKLTEDFFISWFYAAGQTGNKDNGVFQ